MSNDRAKPAESEGIWARNERIRMAELRADSDRPIVELLEQGIELSRFASELSATARAEPLSWRHLSSGR